MNIIKTNIIFFLLAYHLGFNRNDLLIIKISEQIMETDHIKYRKFGLPFFQIEYFQNENISINLSFRYNFFNYKDSENWSNTNYYEYFGVLIKRALVELGLRGYVPIYNIGNLGFTKFYFPIFANYNFDKSENVFSDLMYTYKIPCLGFGAGLQQHLGNKFLFEIELNLKKGLKYTYLNRKLQNQINKNYHQLVFRVGIGYKIQ